jgi:hypothetical protein
MPPHAPFFTFGAGVVGMVEPGEEDDLTPEQANAIMASWKQHLREEFGEDLRRVNEVRFKLTGVLKEFNKYQSKWLARLELFTCGYSIACEEGEKHAIYELLVTERDTDYVIASISFDYDLSRDVKRIVEVAEVSDHYVLSLHEVYDFLALALKLAHAFYTASPARPTVTSHPTTTRGVSAVATPEDVMERKRVLREQFIEDERRRINELRFKLTRVIREFNRQQGRWLTWLKMAICEPVFCKEEKIVDYDILVSVRDTGERVARITLSYNLTKDVRRLLGVYGFTDGRALGFKEFCDVLALALKLMHAFL